MATSFQQTDTTTGACAVASFCTGNSVNAATFARLASEGGTAGSGSMNLTIDGSANNLNAVAFTVPDGTNNLEDLDGATGDWTFRYHVTAARAQHSWTGAAACRVNSSCTNQETICDDQTFSVGLNSTGVKSQVVTQSSTITMGATDLIACVYAFDSSTGSALNHLSSPSQNIDSPWSAGGAAPSTTSVSGPVSITLRSEWPTLRSGSTTVLASQGVVVASRGPSVAGGASVFANAGAVTIAPQGPTVQSGATISVDPAGVVVSPKGPTISTAAGSTTEVSSPMGIIFGMLGPTISAAAAAAVSRFFGVNIGPGVGKTGVRDPNRDVGDSVISEYSEE